ncbi:MAG: mobile mystery protein B [Elusimicrobia bacterium]|jgi:Fic-DOC domain mobile mystery protein B|nr:mobile mystery protein B [Elusimicrobiota bacterium]
MKFKYPEGATPIDLDEAEGLLVPHISNREELDRWEQDNINEAEMWLAKKKDADIISVPFITKLHKRMFNNVWKWAGKFRKSDKNIGCPWYEITQKLKILCDDANFWIENKTYPPEEIAYRFHHKLVSIHPFPNGNGRHARMMSDLILEMIFKKPRFTWGSENLVSAGKTRKRYIKSLYAADKGDYSLLSKFVRS